MYGSKAVIFVLALGALCGCAGQQTAITSTKSYAGMDTSGSHVTEQERMLMEQAQALDGMSREILRNATLRGAGIGAAAGCGLALVSASSAGRCIGGALVGGAIGGVAGHAIGKNQVANRVQIVSRDDAARAISRTSARVGSLNTRLHDLLAAQDREIAAMKRARAADEMTQAEFDARLSAMRDTRAALGQALTLSAKRAAEARQLLLDAQHKGQQGLTWHIDATEELEADALSAKSAISLI